jgi:hypothetical protein
MAKTQAQKQFEQEQEATQLPAPKTSTALAVSSGFQGAFQAMLVDSGPRTESPFKYLRMVQDNGYSEEVDGVAVDVPFGNFHISGTNLYAKEVTFRPILVANKIMKRAGQEDKFKVLGETIYFTDWNGESRIDTLGTVDCGRLFGKNLKNLSPEAQKLEKDKATLYVDIFGLVSIGDSDQHLVRLRLSRGKMMRWSNATEQRTLQSYAQQRSFKLKLVLPKNDPLLTPQEQKDANNNSVNLIVTADMTKKLPLEDIQTTGDGLLEWVYGQNMRVKELHLEAIKRSQQGESSDLPTEVVDDLEYIMDAEYEEIN